MKSLVLTMLMLSLGSLPVLPQEMSEATERDVKAPCNADCRGLGIEKVKAGDEHCGLVARERKERALDLACSLSVENQDDLQTLAEERAWSKCSESRDRDVCQCEVELRPWANVYTHVLSQRCWAECGWAYLIRCEPAAADREES